MNADHLPTCECLGVDGEDGPLYECAEGCVVLRPRWVYLGDLSRHIREGAFGASVEFARVGQPPSPLEGSEGLKGAAPEPAVDLTVVQLHASEADLGLVGGEK